MSQATPPSSPIRHGLARRALSWLLPTLVIATAAGIWQRERLWLWYCAERLERSSAEDKHIWAEKLVAAGEAGAPTLLKLLESDDPRVCATVTTAIDNLMASWPNGDPRRNTLAAQLLDAEPRFSTPGRVAALDLIQVVCSLGDSQLSERAKGILATTAKSESTEARVHTIAVALRPEIDGLDAIVPLIDDSVAEVRRAAVLALGPVKEGGKPAMSDEQLLRCLHDNDEEVREFAEMGLRSRGRTSREIRLGRKYASPQAAERQKLLVDLAYEEELDTTVWLERLTNDVDPAVRAGAARVAAERKADLVGRLSQMSRSDPDATVRRIVDYYQKKMAANR